jgi:putative transposase
MTSYPSRRTTRLRDYDYSQAGAYFVTLCIEQRLPLLGGIRDGQVELSPAGTMVATVWSQLDRYYPVGVDAFVVMPNHLHGILVLGEGAREDRDGATVPTIPGFPTMPASSTAPTVPATPTVPIVSTDTIVPPRSMSLSTIIQRFKTFTMHEYGKGVAAEGWPRYPGRLWQVRFHDHVIRNERELAAIREYIANNPLQWQLDRENPERMR